MLAIILYTPLFAFAILNIWWMLIIFRPMHGFDLDMLECILSYVNKIFKTSISPYYNSFLWALLAIAIHIGLSFTAIESIDLLNSLIPITPNQSVVAFVFACIGILLFYWGRNKLENILWDPDKKIMDSETDEIIQWINKYKKIPFLLRIALHKDEGSYFSDVYKSMTLHQELQKELPQKVERVKKNKI